MTTKQVTEKQKLEATINTMKKIIEQNKDGASDDWKALHAETLKVMLSVVESILEQTEKGRK